MKRVKILCVCGSGTVSSAMVANKLKEKLKDKGFDVDAIETSPNGIDSAISGTQFDLIACVSPVYADFGIPKVTAIGLLTGLGEDKVIDECVEILNKKA